MIQRFALVRRVCMVLTLFVTHAVLAQKESLATQAEHAMVKATKFMVDSVSNDGGYVWYYLPDMSRRWGEMEAYPSQVWVQDGGTVSVGHMLLDVYHTTGNAYFYEAAEKAAHALIKGQSKEGGWNYLVDFGGEKSLKQWYATIGKNGWRLEEFQHYYGNDTYDDDVTSDAARFLLRMYLEKKDNQFKAPLDKAIDFMLRSQYPNGGWPQRFPLMYDFKKNGHPDYTSFYTYNDDVIWENVHFLIQCYQTLGDERLLDPIKRGMNFYYLSQQPNGAWGQQYDMNMKVAGARTYEPAAYLPRATYGNCMLMLQFYQYTGDRKFLEKISAAIQWLEAERLPDSLTENGEYTHALFVDTVTGKPVFVHRRGSNVKYGYYYLDNIDTGMLAHMRGKSRLDIQKLKDEYVRVSALTPEQATVNSPLQPQDKKTLKATGFNLSKTNYYFRDPTAGRIEYIINALDGKGRWLVKQAMISHPYIGDGVKQDSTLMYAGTFVGDETDTSPYRDTSDQLYISTPAYIRNMEILNNYIKDHKTKE